MNHYVIEPVACTPASGWDKGLVENHAQFLNPERACKGKRCLALQGECLNPIKRNML